MRQVVVTVLAIIATTIAAIVAGELCNVVSAEEARSFVEMLEKARRDEAKIKELRLAAQMKSWDEYAGLVIKAQPYYKRYPRKAWRLADIIYEASTKHKIDTSLAIALAFRESSLLPIVGDGRRKGDAGEEGYFQIMPDSYPRRVCGKGRDMTLARHNADTAMCYLSHVRELCRSSDVWVWVAAYGMDHCPTPEEARNKKTRRARKVLCELIGDRCNTVWPN